MREISSIVGVPVISVAEGIELGRVREVVIDLAQGAVMGIIIEREAVEHGVWSDDVSVIGPDAIMLADQSKVQPLTEMPQLMERRRGSLERPTQVLTASGTKVGILADIFIDPQSRQVVRYEISGGPLRDLTDGTLSFATISGMVHGRDIVVIPDEAIAELPEQVGGLKGAWGRLSETLRDDYKGASEKAGSIYKASAERLKDAVETAKEKSQEVSKVIGEKVEHARDSLQSKVESGSKDAATDEAETPADVDESECSPCDDSADASAEKPSCDDKPPCGGCRSSEDE